MRLSPLLTPLAIVRLAASSDVPSWVADTPFLSITRTDEELSIVCAEDRVPQHVSAQRGWLAFKVEGPLDLATPGILAGLAAPLAEAKIPIFAISTYDTDYLLVRASTFEAAARVLRGAGNTIG